MLTVDVSIAHAFFDRAAVIKSMSVKERRALSRIGAYVRRRARTDVLRRTAPKGTRRQAGRGLDGRFTKVRQSAAPGNPPLVRSRSSYATLRNIQFGLSSDGQSVVIGPVGLNAKKLKGSSRETVPELMEFGGSASVDEYRFVDGRKVGFWFRGKSNHPKTVARKRRTTYAAHPFMSTALDREVAAGNVLDAFSLVRN